MVTIRLFIQFPKQTLSAWDIESIALHDLGAFFVAFLKAEVLLAIPPKEKQEQ